MKKEPTMGQLFKGMENFCKNGSRKGNLVERSRKRPRKRMLREQEELPPMSEPLDEPLDVEMEEEGEEEKTFELDVSSFDPEDEYYVVELPQETEETLDDVLDDTDIEVIEKIDLPEEAEEEVELEDGEEELEVEKESKYVDLGPAIREWRKAKRRSIRSRHPRFRRRR